MTLEFRVLGPVEALVAGEPLRLGGRKQRALLAILLLHANEVVSSDRLIDELWDSDAPDTASKALQVHVSQLRKALEPQRDAGSGGLLVTKAPGYVLEIVPDQLDAARFERLVADGRRLLETGDAAAALANLDEALALWRGSALADLAYASFAQAEIGRLDELRLAAIEDRFEAHLACGHHGDIIGELERFVVAEPLRERPRGQLMLALYRTGRQADALELYRTTRELLVEQLGIEPGRALQDLHAAILAHDPALDAPAAPAAGDAQPLASSEPPPPRPAEDFVGRQAELADLEVALEGALMGRGSVCLVRGEPGIGKSRLADELAERARGVEAQVLWGRCWEAGGAPAYWPWVQSLREHVRGIPAEELRAQLGAGAGEVAHLIPELRDQLSDLPVLESPDSEGARFRLFDATASFLKRTAMQKPLVLVLEDLHAADTPSLLLLTFVASELAGARILIVGTYRDLELSPSNPAAGALVEVERQQATRSLPLRGFAEADVSRLIEVIAGVSPSRRLAAAIHSATGGNPLFVRELVRLLVAEGRLEQPVDETGVRLALPRGVREVIARRLAQVSDAAREMLEVASVLGREFALDALAQVTARPADDLLGLLDEAIAEGVIAESPGGAFRMRFSHVLIRDALYDELGAGRRMQLHLRAGVALEKLHERDLDPHLAEIAYHFADAGPGGDPRQAYEYARKAGDRAARLLAHEEAVRLYGIAIRAAKAADAVDDRERCETLVALGYAHNRGGDEERGKEVFRAAADLARQLGDVEALAQSAVGYGGAYVWGASRGDPLLIPMLEEALAALGEAESLLGAKVMARLSTAIRDQPYRERRISLSNDAVAMARRLGDPRTLAYALDARCIAIDGPDTVEEFGETVAEVLRLAKSTGDIERSHQGHVYRSLYSLVRGDMAAARADIDTQIRLAEESREPAYRWYGAGLSAALALFEGRFGDAGQLIPQAYELGRHALSFNATASYALQQAQLERDCGPAGSAEDFLRSLVPRHPTYPIFSCMLAAIAIDAGRHAEAAALLEDLAASDFARMYVDEEYLAGLTLLSEVAWGIDDPDRAAALYAMLLPYRSFNTVAYPELILGSIERPLGILAGMTGRSGESDDHFRRAIDANARMGARPWVARTEHDHARILFRRGEAEDRRRGMQLMAAAREAYDELGMGPWVARVEEELEATR